MAPKGSQTEIRQTAERQWGVVSTSQLVAIGLTRNEVRGLLARQQLLPLFHGVYALGHLRLTMHGRLQGALLSAGPGGFLSHRSAAAHRDLRTHPAVIEVTVVADHTPHPRPGLLLHRTSIPTDSAQVRPHHGLPTATLPRIVIDLARVERPGEIQRLIRESIRHGQFDLAALRSAIDVAPSRPGTGVAQAALQRYLPGSEDRRSWLETQFQNHERSDPRLPPPLYNQHCHGYEIDVMWVDQRVTLELDGRPYHAAVEDFDRDRTKDRTLLRHGWRPVRVSDLEWEHDRTHVLGDLYAVLDV